MVIGVIGTGNMGSALVRGWLRAARPGTTLVVWDKIAGLVDGLLGPDGISAAASLDDLVAKACVILVVVKPKDAPEVLGAMAGRLRQEQIVVSSMAGVTLAKIRGLLGPGPTVLRIMPNLGVELGVGAVAVAAEPDTGGRGIPQILDLFEPLGLARAVPEQMIDAVTAVSGSGPAFLALAIEGLEDGAVAAGTSRPLARSLVRQVALGVGRLLPLYSGSASGLKGHLAANGGLDEAGVAGLERRGTRSAFAAAVGAAVNKSRGSGGGPHVSPR
jgi:pyrroline-5-carboxylate reductase